MPASNEIDDDMGALPAAVLARPGRVRGDHQLSSFTAIGPLAEQLMRDQAPLHVFAPLEALTDTGGVVLLMSVGLDSTTLLHLAEQRAGRTLFRRWANGPEGTPITPFRQGEPITLSTGMEMEWREVMRLAHGAEAPESLPAEAPIVDAVVAVVLRAILEARGGPDDVSRTLNKLTMTAHGMQQRLPKAEEE
jgi:hypothetical protein